MLLLWHRVRSLAWELQDTMCVAKKKKKKKKEKRKKKNKKKGKKKKWHQRDIQMEDRHAKVQYP